MRSRYNVPALQRGLQILRMFSREQKELSGADLSAQLNLPRASIFRILQTLESMGFIERVHDSARYRLGIAVLRLGFEYIASLEITDHARPILEALTESTSYSSHLVVRDQCEVVVIAKAVGHAKLFNSIQVGGRLPVYATVLGRVLVSRLTSQALYELYGELPLQAFTQATPVDLASLEEAIAPIRRYGYGVSEGGFELGISTIAAPVLGARGEVQAAISITVPSATIEPQALPKLVQEVQLAAAKLHTRLEVNPSLDQALKTDAPKPTRIAA
jgi:DNA-binding IclR family transcriptional regulator